MVDQNWGSSPTVAIRQFWRVWPSQSAWMTLAQWFACYHLIFDLRMILLVLPVLIDHEVVLSSLRNGFRSSLQLRFKDIHGRCIQTSIDVKGPGQILVISLRPHWNHGEDSGNHSLKWLFMAVMNSYHIRKIFVQFIYMHLPTSMFQNVDVFTLW